MTDPLYIRKIDRRRIPGKPREIRAFLSMRNELARLPYWLEYNRRIGVDRFFILDNGSNDGSREYILQQPDCHCFHTEGSYFANNVDPPNWQNAALNVYGDGHWCLIVDADELFVYRNSEAISLTRLCAFLDRENADAMICHMIDMYGDVPISRAAYRPGTPFVEAAPYFDPEPGWFQKRDQCFPSQLMFGGVRERALWPGRFKRHLPPCLTKVPLVRWRKGRKYLVSTHMIDRAVFSDIQGALLHFKFLIGFEAVSSQTVVENQGVNEKGLQERQAYLEVLAQKPDLVLKNANSVRYRDTAQLVQLGWMRSSKSFEDQFNA